MLNLVFNIDSKLSSIQKAYTGYEFLQYAFKYAALPIAKDVQSICQIIPKRDVSNGFCILSNFVIQYTTLQNLWKIILHEVPSRNINKNYIRVYDSIVDARSVDVTVVFANSTTVVKYIHDEQLSTNINKILTCFILVNSCIVILQDSKIQSEIVYIIVHNVGSRKSVSRVVSSTVINIKRIISVDKFKQMCIDSNSFKIAGLTKQLNFLTSLYNAQVFNKARSREENFTKTNQKVLIIGPPGCGKTSLVKYFAHSKQCGLITIEGSDIASAEPGKSESTLKSLFNEAVNRSQEEDDDICIIFLDQVESICGTKKSSALHLKRISQQLFHLLEEISDNPGVLVIATTNNVHALDSAVRRADRLEIEIYIGVPTEKERQEILQLHCSTCGIKSSVSNKIAVFTPGYIGADIALLVREVNRLRVKNKQKYGRESELLELFRSCIAKHRPASLRSGLGIVESANTKLSDLGGLFKVKIDLRSFVEWPLKYPKSFNRLGIPVPKGILLYGPPGCAKTSLTCAIANATNTNFLSISAAELYSPYVGEAERNVIELFHKARVNSPCIVFIDEIDALVGNRNVSSKNVQEKILSTFLTEMDGVGNKIDSFTIQMTNVAQDEDYKTIAKSVIVIAATNRPDKLDSALLRPGRFDKLLFVGAPDLPERLDILQTIAKQCKMPLAPCVDLLEVAKRTEDFTGADLSNLIREAGLASLFEQGMNADCVKQDHILKSLKTMKPRKHEQLDYQELMEKTKS